MTILVATDFSDASRPALRRSARLASSWQSPMRVIHCIESAVEGPPWGHLLEVPPDMEEQLKKRGRERLEQFLDETLTELPPKTVEYRVELTGAQEGIVAAASAEQIELVVLGATGRSRLGELLLGSTAEEVVRASESPVWVVPPDDPAGPLDSVVAPIDLSICSRESLRFAADMARREAASLHVLHVFAPPSADAGVFSSMFSAERTENVEEKRRERYSQFLEGVDLEGVDVETTFERGEPHESIAEHVDEIDANLVVLGTHGRREFEWRILGGTTSKVLRRLPCSVLTVRGGETRSD